MIQQTKPKQPKNKILTKATNENENYLWTDFNGENLSHQGERRGRPKIRVKQI